MCSGSGSDAEGAGVVGALALVGEYADDLVVGGVREVHAALARRVFAVVDGLVDAPGPRRMHDALSGAAYAGVGVALRASTGALRWAERRRLGPRLEARAGGRQVLSALNGFVGDRLARERPDYAITMAVRCAGGDVPLVDLSDAFPGATGDLVVFLHGLGENDESWERHQEKQGGSYGARLGAETTWTPVYLRANTGLPIAENGVALAALLDGLVASWPVPVRRVALVGHSMGGLIIRSACAVAGDSDSSWTPLVTDVVTLGTPHLGAPLERTVHLGARVLGALPESAPIGRILDFRSVGILDLRRGLAADVRHLPEARYHLVAATLGASHRHPVSELLGDLFVRYPSATGRPRRGAAMFPGGDVLHMPRTGHFGLLNHPDVYDALRAWLD